MPEKKVTLIMLREISYSLEQHTKDWLKFKECEKLNIKADFISKSAKLKIEKAGGVISILKEKA